MALEPWPYRLRVNGIILPPIVKEIVAAFRRWASEDSGYIRSRSPTTDASITSGYRISRSDFPMHAPKIRALGKSPI